MTPAEAFLWKHLKARQFENHRFTRQHSIGNFIVDFYCAQEKLIIELDGAGHFTEAGLAYDKKRTEYLESKGFKVIRFENNIVFKSLSAVLDEIKQNFK